VLAFTFRPAASVETGDLQNHDCGRVALQDAARVAERACGWRAIIFDQEALRAALRVADR
jgi:hypothetical protein